MENSADYHDWLNQPKTSNYSLTTRDNEKLN